MDSGEEESGVSEKSALRCWEIGYVERSGGHRILNTPLAQRLERRSYKPYGAGSIPAGRILALRIRCVYGKMEVANYYEKAEIP